MYQITPDDFPEGDTKYRTDLTEAKRSADGPVGTHDPVGVVALVLGIIAVISVWNIYLGVVIGAAAAIVGMIAWRRAHDRDGRANFAVAAVVLGAVAVALSLFLTVVVFSVLDQAHSGAQTAADKSDAQTTMLAVEAYKTENNNQAPAKLEDLEPSYISAVPISIQYYRNPFDTTVYRICLSLDDGFFKCENAACAEAQQCGGY